MPPSSPPRFVRRLGLHHFAHLRAVAEGLPVLDSARRYLGIDHGHQASTAHQQTIDAVRTVARRHAGMGDWRLIGLRITLSPAGTAPSLEDFTLQQGLDGWSEAEVLQMYEDAYPADPRQQRRARLRQRQLALLRRLETLAAEQPLPDDLVTGWFDEATAGRLLGAGLNTLGELHQRIGRGGRWFSTMPGIGTTKAQRIAAHLRNLLPDVPLQAQRLFRLQAASTVTALAINDPAAVGLLNTDNDLQAIESWIAARSGSQATAKLYRREAQRLLLWLQTEKSRKLLSAVNVDDCNAYMAFLANIPADWISRHKAQPGQLGWAPFRGPLSLRSRQQAITIIASLFAWLQSARYLKANPWVLVNQKLGDDKEKNLLDSKALSEAAIAQVLAYIERQDPSAARARIRFILLFTSTVGLRSAELLAAKLGDLHHEQEGWMLQVHGKGAKNRIAAIPPSALLALRDYLHARGLGDDIASAPAQAPLLASTVDAMSSIGYQALYEHVRGWLSKAVAAAALPEKERLKLAQASTHWLRHTFGTRAIAKGVPLDVIQAQMGHASIQTTTSIYGRAPIQRRADELGKAFG